MKESVIDYIIKKWFPILGILFVVGGISYLFYNGVWQTLNESGRLVLGFILGIAFLAGGFSFEKNLKHFADAIIGGGILILYITLIYGSRFEITTSGALIPEMAALLIATAFSFAVAFYSYVRKSKYILILGMLGGYLTPFFIGQSGEFTSFLETQTAFQYSLPLMAFLLYFTAINLAVFFVSTKMFLRGIGLLNSLGLFLGTLSLTYLMGDQFAQNITALSIFSVFIVLLHIAAMTLNAKNFQSENDPFLVAGYLLPLLWFWILINGFLATYLAPEALTGLFGFVAFVYFGAWYYIRTISHSDKHFALYIGGILSIILALLQLQDFLRDFSGLAISAVSIVFAILFTIKPLSQRAVSFFIFAIVGLILTLVSLPTLTYDGFGPFKGVSIFAIASLLPFCFSFIMAFDPKVENEYLFRFRQILAYLALIAISLIFLNDLFNLKEIPQDFLFLTIPALILVPLMYSKKNLYDKIIVARISVIAAFLGFFLTFFEMLDRFVGMPETVMPLGGIASLTGLITVGIFAAIKYHITRVEVFKEKESGFIFIITFLFYLTLWTFVTHELIATFNLFDFDFADPKYRGIRAFSVTIWWAGLGSFMTLRGTQKESYLNEKNIGFGLLAATILKLIFYDLANVNTDLKVFLFILIGLAILGISYVANKKSENEN